MYVATARFFFYEYEVQLVQCIHH